MEEITGTVFSKLFLDYSLSELVYILQTRSICLTSSWYYLLVPGFYLCSCASDISYARAQVFRSVGLIYDQEKNAINERGKQIAGSPGLRGFSS